MRWPKWLSRKPAKKYDCNLCRDIGILKTNVTLATYYVYGDGEKVVTMMEPTYWNYPTCTACNGGKWNND